MKSGNVTQPPVKRWRELLASERDAAALYQRLAAAERGERQQIFRDLSAIELKHAAHWESKLRSAGAEVPPPGRPSLRTRLLGAAAGRLSTQAVLPLIERAERADAGLYDSEPGALPEMAADERGHARILARLLDGGKPDPVEQIARRERWHRGDRSGALRAGVFGVSDGLVSNTALAMGFAGSGASASAHPAVVQAMRLLEADLARDWTLTGLAAELHVAPGYLVRLFNAATGLPPMAYLAQLRAEHAAVLLLHTDEPVTSIGRTVGWPDQSMFARRFKAHYGLSATSYRKRFANRSAHLHHPDDPVSAAS